MYGDSHPLGVGPDWEKGFGLSHYAAPLLVSRLLHSLGRALRPRARAVPTEVALLTTAIALARWLLACSPP